MHVVTLTSTELLHGAIAGVFRHVQNLRAGRRDRYGCSPDEGWQKNIEGAIAELAAAKASGRYWVGLGALGDFTAADVRGLQVRHSPGDDHRLVLHKTDNPADPFVLVTGRPPRFTLRGWIYAGDGQRAEYWLDPTGANRWAYFVPQTALRPMGELPSTPITDRELRWQI